MHNINTKNVINMNSETHFAFHTQIDPSQYPQVHDFYELTLITRGKMLYELVDQRFNLTEGSLVFVRPGDVHSKISLGECTHINLAFPSSTIDSLFEYLYSSDIKETLLSLALVPVTTLCHNEKNLLQSRLERLSLFPVQEEEKIRTYLRIQLIDVMSKYFIPVTYNKVPSDKAILPIWLERLLKSLDSIDNLANGLDNLENLSGKTKEHICREFRKHLHTTPVKYINSKRLNYVANMLMHSDHEIIDLAFDVGFQSLSYFYHIFKQEYGISPHKYRQSKKRIY
ncbi:helix-turn-helix transcriptional regulator [Petrocella sp. FN5]|uniref:helix-turn-helix transcriptional regulator n=1 Tax=Petrocella sp. FN5 TaxID=3032002 RepID=UPI0023DB2001|nr:AraC family transcriptional regulator [Petrocella sp. FN5]MDF1616853.1 AraC family transcriptional regulator [Petrocella sp. FN5]